MKTIRVTMVLVALVLLAGLGAMSVAAEGPVASTSHLAQDTLTIKCIPFKPIKACGTSSITI